MIGALALGRIPDAGVRRMIGGILLALIVFYLLRQYAARNGDAELIPFTATRAIAVTGIAVGFTTMVANASGPIMMLYLLALRLPKVAFIGTAAWFFLFLNLFKLPFSVGRGRSTPTHWRSASGWCPLLWPARCWANRCCATSTRSYSSSSRWS